MRYAVITGCALLAAASFMAFEGAARGGTAIVLAQTQKSAIGKESDPGRGQTDNPGDPGKVTDAGRGVPCDASAQSDRTGGGTKTSDKSNSNMGGGVKGSGC